jgi:uncharacterized protein DUF3300
MKRLNQCFSWLTTVALVLGTSGLDACGSNKSVPVTVAQTQQPDSQGPGQAAAPAAQNTPADASQATQLPAISLTADGLDELLAPIALYPDPVLAVMLQAAVDPQEVMDGGNWLAVDNNANLKEAALDQASQKAGFTPVMQALLHYPTVVDLMCTQFDWTKQLGAAYEGNPKAVLESVQRLRAQAVDNGALQSSPQMKVNITQDQGQQVVKLEPGDPQTVYVPSYDPSRVYSTTTTSTSPNGTTTTTTTTSSPAPATTTSSGSSTAVVQEKSGVSTGTAVLIGLLSFGAGIAVGAAISSNNYYYPAWGYGGVWYGPRPYYPPPYYPHYYGGWHGGYNYNRPVHYGNTNIYINNSNNYYNRFNNNNNMNANYRPKPVPYNNKPGGVYANSMGNRPNTRQQGVTYQPKNNANVAARPATGNVQQRPAAGNAGNNPNVGTRPAQGGNNAEDWKGQTTYKGKGGANTAQQPVGGAQTRPAPGNANAGANNRVSPETQPSRNSSGDRGFGQPGGTRPATGNEQISRPTGGNAQARPATSNQPANRPSTGNQPANRPSTANQPAARPAQQPASRPQNSGGAFGGASNPSSDRAASNRGHNSMGDGGAKPTQTKTAAPAGRKK